MQQLIIVAGDSGVYAGIAEGGVEALGADGAITLTNARHLRRYYTAGRQGAGSASDLAIYGLGVDSPSVGPIVPGQSRLLGVRRAFPVAASVAASFGVPL